MLTKTELSTTAPPSEMMTMTLTPEIIATWHAPPFQRPLTVNSKVMTFSDEMKEMPKPEINGVLTLGTVGDDHDKKFMIDGQHRTEGAKISGLSEFIAHIHLIHYATMLDMGVAFVRLNSQLVKMRPDDHLRGLEGHLPLLRLIREQCPFIGYSRARRTDCDSAAVLSMAQTIRAWSTSEAETPSINAGGSATHLAQSLTEESVKGMLGFLNVAHTAWGSDRENFRLWSVLNMTLCMWLWRSMVLQEGRHANMRAIVIDAEQFKRCLMSVAANGDYVDWLLGRNIGERDRSPAYMRLRSIFTARLKADGFASPKMPQPAWVVRWRDK